MLDVPCVHVGRGTDLGHYVGQLNWVSARQQGFDPIPAGQFQRLSQRRVTSLGRRVLPHRTGQHGVCRRAVGNPATGAAQRGRGRAALRAG